MFDPNPVKSDANLEKHGFSFETVERFEWRTAIEARDVRRRYLEVRTVAVGLIGTELCVFVFTRRGERIRPISLRRANDKEALRYVRFHER